MFAGLVIGTSAAARFAAIDADFDLTWHTIDGGGGASAGGGFELAGTIGQPDAGTMTGGDFILSGGFMAGVSAAPPEPPICPADINGDAEVDGADLSLLLGAWGQCDDPEACAADLTGDGQVDGADLSLLLGAWGPCE